MKASVLDGGWIVNAMPQPLYSPERNPVPITQEAWWAPGPVWMGTENLTPPPGFNLRTIRPIERCGPQFIKAI